MLPLIFCPVVAFVIPLLIRGLIIAGLMRRTGELALRLVRSLLGHPDLLRLRAVHSQRDERKQQGDHEDREGKSEEQRVVGYGHAVDLGVGAVVLGDPHREPRVEPEDEHASDHEQQACDHVQPWHQHEQHVAVDDHQRERTYCRPDHVHFQVVLHVGDVSSGEELRSLLGQDALVVVLLVDQQDEPGDDPLEKVYDYRQSSDDDSGFCQVVVELRSSAYGTIPSD